MFISHNKNRLSLPIDEYRVTVERSCTGSSSHGDYLLRVYDDMIKLFTPSGVIPTKFSVMIKDIFDIRFQMSDLRVQKFVTLSIKNAATR